MFEGGVKGVAFVQGGKNVLPDAVRGTSFKGLMHAVDLLPSLASAAGITPAATNLDGADFWPQITGASNEGAAAHADMPLNILPVCDDCEAKDLKFPPYSAIIEADTNMKLIDGHVGPN